MTETPPTKPPLRERAIAHRLGVSEKAIRKLVGPLKPAESAQLAFAGMTTAAAGQPPAARVPSAKSTGDDADRATPSAKDRAGDGDPITTPADDGEPVPMSLDRDASDRTFDRQLAHLGCSTMPHRSSARGPRFPVSASCSLSRVWSRAGCFGSAASSTVKSVRPSMACARRC